MPRAKPIRKATNPKVSKRSPTPSAAQLPEYDRAFLWVDPDAAIRNIVGPGVLKDSGARREFATGAVRDAPNDKGRFDLLQVHGILALARQLERGAKKYGDRNFEKGMPLSVFANSALRHLLKVLAGYTDEPHLDAAIWNIASLIEIKTRIEAGLLPPELNDLPTTFTGVEPSF
jgi:hypothetical protein